MEKTPDPRPDSGETVVKKPADDIEDKDLADVSGGVLQKRQLSGPYDDRIGDAFTCSAELAK